MLCRVSSLRGPWSHYITRRLDDSQDHENKPSCLLTEGGFFLVHFFPRTGIVEGATSQWDIKNMPWILPETNSVWKAASKKLDFSTLMTWLSLVFLFVTVHADREKEKKKLKLANEIQRTTWLSNCYLGKTVLALGKIEWKGFVPGERPGLLSVLSWQSIISPHHVRKVYITDAGEDIKEN